MSSDVELLDGAVPLVRWDQPWQWYVNFHDDPDGLVPTDLTGKTISAAVRWRGPGGIEGGQTVAAYILDPLNGQVRLSLTAQQTAPMPLGRLTKLFIAINLDTEAIVPVTVMEGLFGVPMASSGTPPALVLAPASGDVIVLADLRPLYINNATTLASLFIRMPITGVPGNAVEVSYRSPITALQIQDAGGTAIALGPTNAFGPGSGMTFRYVDYSIGWVYWR